MYMTDFAYDRPIFLVLDSSDINPTYFPIADIIWTVGFSFISYKLR